MRKRERVGGERERERHEGGGHMSTYIPCRAAPFCGILRYATIPPGCEAPNTRYSVEYRERDREIEKVIQEAGVGGAGY